MRIGFLFNHDQIHQVAHSLPIAMALARSGADVEILAAVTNARLAAEVRRLGGDLIGRRIQLVEIGLRRWDSRLAHATLEPVIPAAKLLVYRDNLAFFRSLDMLVVAEKTSLVLKARYGLDRLQIVHTRHGAGDRAIGFDAASAGFDHVLVSGRKIRERLVAEAKLDPARISIVGYPKFDLPPEPAPLPPGFDDGRPIVLYNPHPSPHLSSWYSMGRKVLDWFVAHPDWRLIFAPHVMLFARPYVVTVDKLRIDRPGRLAERYRRARNIHIDLDSRALTTMAYTDRADLYLGDASSQVYEFLRHPRPCAFLNPGRLAWRDDPNFAHWRAGPVIEDADDLAESLARARAKHESRYRPIQTALFDYSFDLTAESSAVRAARVIAALARVSAPALPVAAEPVAAHG